MGPAIASLRPAVEVSRENPIFLAAALLTLIGSGLGSFVASRIPVVGDLVNSVFLTPAFAALMLGMAAAGLATDAASFGDGVESLRANYRSLVVSYAVLIFGVVLLVVAWAVEVAVVVVVESGVRSAAEVGSLDPATLATSGPVVGLTFLMLALALVGGLVVQFFDVAIVVDGESALTSFGASWRLFRDAPGSVLGYSVLRMLPVVATGALVGGGYLLGRSAFGPIGAVLLAVLVAALFGPVTFAFITAYHVAYYEGRTAGSLDSS